MKQTLLFILAVMASGFAIAQIAPGSTSAREFQAPPLTQVAPAINKYSNSRAVADTIFPSTLSQECANAVLFSTAEDGFVFGTNEFLDIEKIQRISLEEPVNLTVSEVLVGFAFADAALANKRVSVNIYNELDADGNLTAAVGSSDTLTIAQTAVYDSTQFFTTFTFSTPVQLTDASSFLIGVDLFEVYFDEDGALDTLGNIGIFSTPDGCGDGTNVLEVFPVEGGFAFNNVFANWQGLNAEMFVGAIVDRDPFTSTRTVNADYAAVAYPNPVEQDLTVSFSAPASGTYQIRIVSASGAVVANSTVNAVRGENRADINAAELPAGVYLFQVEGQAGVQTGRFVKQ